MPNNIKKDCKHSKRISLGLGYPESFRWCRSCGALQRIDDSGWISSNAKERRSIYGEWELPEIGKPNV